MSAALSYDPLASSGERPALHLAWQSIAPGEWPFVADLVELPAPRAPERKPSVGVPNFMSATSPPTGAWLAVQTALRSFLGLRIGAKLVSGDDEDIFSGVLASPKLQAFVHDTGDTPEAHAPICAYALGIARNKRADVLEARRRESEAARDLFPDYGTRARPSSKNSGERIHIRSTRCAGVNRVERAAVNWLDSRRHRVPLTTAFELETFWSDVREWAGRQLRARFGATWSVGFVPVTDRSELPAVRLEGRSITPEEGTWISLAGGREPAIELHSDTKPEDAFAREYAAVYRAFFRARRAGPLPDESKGIKT